MELNIPKDEELKGLTISVIGIPKTIDNDIYCSEVSLARMLSMPAWPVKPIYLLASGISILLMCL